MKLKLWPYVVLAFASYLLVLSRHCTRTACWLNERADALHKIVRRALMD